MCVTGQKRTLIEMNLTPFSGERLKIPADVLEAQHAHAKKNEISQAYDLTGFLEQRKSAMQQWADHPYALPWTPMPCQ